MQQMSTLKVTQRSSIHFKVVDQMAVATVLRWKKRTEPKHPSGCRGWGDNPPPDEASQTNERKELMNTKEITQLLDRCDAPLLRYRKYNQRIVFVAEAIEMRNDKPVIKGRELEAVPGYHGRLNLKDNEWFYDESLGEPPMIRESEMTLSPREFGYEVSEWVVGVGSVCVTEEEWREQILAPLNAEYEDTRPNNITGDDVNALLIATGRTPLSDKSAQSMTPAVKQLLVDLLQTAGEPCHA